jgi:STE24 endopeptidase
MDEERKKLAKKYEKIKLVSGIAESIVSLILLILFLITGYSLRLQTYALSLNNNPYIALLIYLVVLAIVSAILLFPVEYYFGYRLEQKFGLSNLTFWKWIVEGLKSAGVGIVLGVPILLLFYYILLNYHLWWFWFGFVIIIYSVILVQVAPVIIFPIFYKFKPLEREDLKERILNLCNQVGFKVKGVFSFDMSKTTKKANAAFTGMGRTKRIILGDTLLSGFSDDEIETVFAHELGHYKKGHIRKNILISFISTFIELYLIYLIYSNFLTVVGFQHSWDIGALPLLAIISGILGFLSSPLFSSLSRMFEYEADRFAIGTTKNFDSFRSMMEKLAFQNLTDEEPNKLVEFWFHSHPSIKRRIKAGEKYYNILNEKPG